MPASTRWESSVLHNLPAEVGSFVGRESECAELAKILPHQRLLTLTGSGGSGKTRLALRFAHQVRASFADGVWLVQLAPLTEGANVPRAVAEALGIRDTSGQPLQETLIAALSSRRMLLILDNCEHVIDASALLAEALLHACPNLRILATSREPLRIAGEVVWRVQPLRIPEIGSEGSAQELTLVESVVLFLDRARARRRDFTLSEENASAVATICRWLEGMPLGIELAAAQVATLAPQQIAARLDEALTVLRGGRRTLPRQQTLEAALDWSYALLTAEEQALFRHLAVFPAGFNLAAAEGVCVGGAIHMGRVLPHLTALVEKSLVEAQLQAGEMRYRLLQPIRQYAWKHLTQEGCADSTQRRHAAYFLSFVEAAEPMFTSAERRASMERVAVELDNLRTALAWCRRASEAGDCEVGVRLAGALFWFWNFRGEASEGFDWLEPMLARCGDVAPPARAKALMAAAELGALVGRSESARARAEESVATFRVLGNKRELAYALQSLPLSVDHPRSADFVAESRRLFDEVGDAWGAAMAVMAVDFVAILRDGDPGGATAALLEDALGRWRELGDEWGIAQTLNILGDIARKNGDDDAARNRYEDALAVLSGHEMVGPVPSLLHNLGYLALRRGDARHALRFFQRSMELFRRQGDRRGIAECLAGIAGVLGVMKNAERAVRLFGASEAQMKVVGATVWVANGPDYERNVAWVRDQLSHDRFTELWAMGRGLTLDDAVAEAMAGRPTGAAGTGLDGTDLTSREIEIAALIARGLTNRQIAAQLVITEGTARLHVKHVLRKLGFSSRAQVAAWAVDRGLATGPQSM